MTERTWARIGLALLFGLTASTVVLLALAAFAAAPAITLAVILGIISALGVYIYDVRTETPNGE